MNNILQLSENELKMFEEVFQVMNKYKNERTFGLQLIHSHFSISDDEVLYETHDSIARELKITPIKKSNFSTLPKATAWKQLQKSEIEVAMFCCDDDDLGNNVPEKLFNC